MSTGTYPLRRMPRPWPPLPPWVACLDCSSNTEPWWTADGRTLVLLVEHSDGCPAWDQEHTVMEVALTLGPATLGGTP